MIIFTAWIRFAPRASFMKSLRAVSAERYFVHAGAWYMHIKSLFRMEFCVNFNSWLFMNLSRYWRYKKLKSPVLASDTFKCVDGWIFNLLTINSVNTTQNKFRREGRIASIFPSVRWFGLGRLKEGYIISGTTRFATAWASEITYLVKLKGGWTF